MGDDAQPPQFNTSDFRTDAYARRVEKPWGYELHWVPGNAPYMGKIIHINEGARLSLQLHDQKQESWLVIKGQASVIWENDQGELVQTRKDGQRIVLASWCRPSSGQGRVIAPDWASGIGW